MNKVFLLMIFCICLSNCIYADLIKSDHYKYLINNFDSAIKKYNTPKPTDDQFSNGILYIDPSASNNGDGTIENPYNTWPKIESNTAYLQKRGTSITAEGLNGLTIDYVLIGAYGTGEDRPIISNTIEIEGEGNVIRNIHAKGHINIADWPYYDAGNCWIYDCECKKIEIFQHNTKVIGNRVHGADTDGIWSSGSKYGQYVYNNEIAYNIVYDINQNWYPGVSESDAPGDGMQLNINKSVHVHHNIIDRSSTGNKFCILVGCSDGGRATARIENNVFFLPKDTDGGGAGVFFTGKIDGIFKNNKFIGESKSELASIYVNSTESEITICGNFFYNCGRSFAYGSESFNNTLINVVKHNARGAQVCKNNVIWGEKDNSVSESNLFIPESSNLNEIFIDPDSFDYRLKQDVVNFVEAYTSDEWTVDLNGNSVNSNISSSIGAYINNGSNSLFGETIDDTPQTEETNAGAVVLDRSLNDLTKLSIMNSKAIADDGNTSNQTIDDDLNTRWSCEGLEKWIQFELSSMDTVYCLNIAWYKGDSRTADFDIQVSEDSVNWTSVLTNQVSSGTSVDFQRVDLPNEMCAKYIRIVGNGNSENEWNSITEVEIYGKSGIAEENTETNYSPVAHFSVSSTEVHPQDKVYIDASSSSDADSDVLTYHWSFPTEISANTDDPVNPHFYAPNVDAETQFTINLYVSDKVANSVLYSQTITISPRPEDNSETNESPIILNQSFDVTKRKSAGDFIAQIVASDPNQNQLLSYSIIKGNNDAIYEINSATGEISANKTILLTRDESHTLNIQVTDNGAEPLSATAFITINLIALEVNLNPEIENQQFEISEKKSSGDLIGQVIASDPNQNQTLSYSIIQGNTQNMFAINSATGEITTNEMIELDSDETFTLKIQVTDTGNEPLSATAFITINLIALEENLSPEIENQQFEISETKSTGDFVGQVIATDANSKQTLSYSITDGNAEGFFKIDSSTGELKANTDISNSTERTVTLIVRVVDNDPYNPLSAYAFVTINIQQVATNKSPVIADQSFDIRKNYKIGNVIGTVEASDPNNNQSLSYSITSGNEEDLFTIDSMTGELSAKSSISFDQDQTINLTVVVTDNGLIPLSSSATIKINLIINGKIKTAEVSNDNPNQVKISFNKDLEDENLKNAYYNSDFTLSNGKNVVSVIISGNEIILELDSNYVPGDEIIVSYTQGSTPILDSSGNPIESFTGYIVDNNIILVNEIGINAELDVEVYPNPSNGIINIKADNLSSDECEISLYSLSGNLVLKSQVYASFGNLQEQVNFSHINRGTYIIRLVCKNQVSQSKITII